MPQMSGPFLFIADYKFLFASNLFSSSLLPCIAQSHTSNYFQTPFHIYKLISTS